jgi:hypothetical protein
MPSAWIERRPSGRGTRYRVKFRAGGRETVPRAAGTFPTAREAKIRRDWVAGELAAMRLPDLTLLAEPAAAPTLREVAERWLESRIDVADHTRLQHRSDVNRAESLLDRRVDEITSADVAELVARLAETRKRATVRKTVLALGMVFDHAGIEPNPARDKRTVKLPKETREEMKPPTADHVLALPGSYRSGTGCRCSSSTTPACAYPSSSGLSGATSTSLAAVGASQRQPRRQERRAG